ncbi:hypothetical protein [Microbacterium kyungheense]|uniref:Uncharacterized protein n=1 Tax=Microbacterium kyungheense TaxID=1263636 RepID=A0A543F1N5_9MICO|nr:hypothetical protein [Microbacterium kyungheense]TQM27713.1 hypothetical protein FB391_1740 [Microbacterium kyungheense]
MSTPRTLHASSSARVFGGVIGGAVGVIVAGLVVLVLGVGLDWGGVGGGAAMGVGVGLVAIGMYVWGYANGLRKAGRGATAPGGAWLPSRDGQE